MAKKNTKRTAPLDTPAPKKARTRVLVLGANGKRRFAWLDEL